MPHSLSGLGLLPQKKGNTMKIFNWVHKRFHHSTLKDGLASNVKNIEPAAIISNADSQAVMKQQVALGDLLGGWKDGILTIGTLGCDPLKTFNQNREYYALESEDGELEQYHEEEHALDGEDKYNAEHEELNPLMQTTFEHNFEDEEDDDVVSASKEEVAMPVAFNKLVVVTTAPPVISHAADEAIESVETDGEKKEKKKKGERITLADLFYADSDVKMDSANKLVLLHEKTTSTLKAKHGLSFTKKLIPLVKDNPHPIKDIKKLMKKMLKRKIHPELDVKNHKAEGSAAGGISSDDNDNDKHMDDAAANDTASLLPINLRC